MTDATKSMACGSWPSPITAAMCAVRPEGSMMGPMFEPQTDGRSLYWLSLRPLEQGRVALMRWDLANGPEQVVGTPWNVRTGVCEYGGGAYLSAAGTTWFSHFADNRLYRLIPGAAPQPLTGEGTYRYADLVLDDRRNRLICVREDFTTIGQGRAEEATQLVGIDLDTGVTTVLASGPDFVASPRLSADGEDLAWLSWNHPNMPWDVTALLRARIGVDGSLSDVRCEASSEPQARMQPRWNSTGELYYLSDADGWWNLYLWSAANPAGRQVTHLAVEMGSPAWLFGMRHWDFVGVHRAAVLYTADGYWHTATVDLSTGTVLDGSLRHAALTSLTVVGDRVFVTGGDERGNGGLYEYAGGKLHLVVPLGRPEDLASIGAISLPRELTIPLPETATTHAGEVCFAWYYPPANRDYVPLSGEKPPVIVQFHGGPTAASPPAFSLSRQFWTSRGFALLDVNYRGSSGRGRDYRHRLYGQYGVVDVEDAVAALRHAAKLGLVDVRRAAISGASSGGFTTLAALAFHKAFAVGINLYGVSDLVAFVETTHKFERYFLRSLVGDTLQDPQLLYRRSPISGLQNIKPLL